MPEADREALKKAEKEIGKNIPKEMVGLDSEDAASLVKDDSES